MMKRILTKEPLRWFLLLWIAMAVVGALLARTIISSGVYVMVLLSRSADDSTNPPHLRLLQSAGVVLNHTLPLSSILIFLLLAALYSFLLWSGLSLRVQPRFFWPYFLLQGLLVAVMQWMLQAHYLALNFYLVLTLCAVVMFKRAAPALLVGMSCLLLFFVLLGINFLQDIPPETHLAAVRFNILSFSDLTTIVFFVLGYLILYTQQSQYQIQLEEAHRELQGAHSRLAASSRQIETLTLLTERQRIARELHDTLAQGIAGMIMQLEVTSAQVHRKNYQQAQEVLSQALADARTTLQDARHAITDLRSRTPRADQLISSVQQEITHFFQKTGIVYHTNLNDLIHTPAHACEHVLRFIGEGLNNVAHHAHAHQVSVEAKRVEKWLVITVQDDGQGFDPTDQALSPGHYGLLGLQERAHLIEGTVSVNSSDGKGTTLEFRVPLAPSGSLDTPHMGATHSSSTSRIEDHPYG
jgi:two-component system, NarL family, sensor histidine kinase YdfH